VIAVALPVAELAACNDEGQPPLLVTSAGRAVSITRADGSTPSFAERQRTLDVMDRHLAHIVAFAEAAVRSSAPGGVA
jgi:hypothetical protein